jgi:23S rRNA (adenine2503-C2)-methyltransferase
MTPVSALLPEELSARLELMPPYRGRQLFEWLHRRLVFTFDEMSSLPQAVREDLARRAALLTLGLGESRRAPDGTLKLRLHLSDGPSIETVLLNDGKGRHTACLSTQAGCGMACSFCRTGQLGLRRNLRDHEIVEQLLVLRGRLLLEQAQAGTVRSDVALEQRQPGAAAPGRNGREAGIDSVVFMGMGEPLANLPALRKAVQVLTHPAGSAMSLRRITISTCGLVGGIRELAESGPHARLAVSLVSADEDLRRRLMPVTAANPLPELRRALLDYQKTAGRRLTLEIVLIEGVNDRGEDLEALLNFVRGAEQRGFEGQPLRALINLIPWNEVSGMAYRRPSESRVDWFESRIREAGLAVAVRASRGGAVAGACGQLG